MLVKQLIVDLNLFALQHLLKGFLRESIGCNGCLQFHLCVHFPLFNLADVLDSILIGHFDIPCCFQFGDLLVHPLHHHRDLPIPLFALLRVYLLLIVLNAVFEQVVAHSRCSQHDHVDFVYAHLGALLVVGADPQVCVWGLLLQDLAALGPLRFLEVAGLCVDGEVEDFEEA